MLTPFFLMVILSWVAPIVDSFDTRLDTLKTLLTDLVTHGTSEILTISLTFIFMFTKPFISHFILWPLSTVILISHFLTYVMSFLLYVMCDDAPLSPNHSPVSSLLSYSWTYPQNVATKKRLLASLSFYFPFFAQKPTSMCPIFHSICILRWIRVFCSCFRFYFHFFWWFST